MNFHTCSTCKIHKPLTRFYKQKGSKNGYTSQCKDCILLYMKKRYSLIKASPILYAAYRQSMRIYYASNPQKQRAAEQRWKNKNPEHANYIRREIRKRYIKNNYEKERGRWAKYKKEHPDKNAQHQARRRAQKATAPIIEKIDRQIIYKRDKMICQICHKKVSRRDATLDHVIPLSQGGAHSYRNLVLTHRKCNSIKGNRPIPQQQRLF